MNDLKPASPITLRNATQDDAPLLLSLIHQAFEEYRGKLDPPSGAHRESLQRITELLASEHALLAYLKLEDLNQEDLNREGSEQPVGCLFYDTQEDALYFHRLSVLPSARRHGVGRALVEAVEREASRLGKARVTLSLRVSLPANRAYYEKLGYQLVNFDFHPGYLQFTTLSMQKELKRRNLRLVEMLPHDPAWRGQFDAEAALLRRVFGDQLVTIHHIGSTSIPGIYAKPIIDMLPVVRDIHKMYAFDPTMLVLGYQPLGEFGLTGRRYYRKGTAEERTHHVHVYEVDNPEIDRHLAFRDYLIAHPEDAQRYSHLKRQLAAQYSTDVEAYMDGKDGLIKELEAKALHWWRAIGGEQEEQLEQ